MPDFPELPQALTTLKIGHKTFDYHVIHGICLDERSWNETHISSTSTGQTARVHSYNTSEKEFWLKSQDGKERKIVLPSNSNFGVRREHQISLICLSSQYLFGDNLMHLAVVNRTTENWILLGRKRMIQKLAGTDSVLIQMLANAFILVTIGLGLIPAFIYDQAIQSKWVRPIEQHAGKIAGWCFRIGG